MPVDTVAPVDAGNLGVPTHATVINDGYRVEDFGITVTIGMIEIVIITIFSIVSLGADEPVATSYSLVGWGGLFVT